MSRTKETCMQDRHCRLSLKCAFLCGLLGVPGDVLAEEAAGDQGQRDLLQGSLIVRDQRDVM